MTPLDALTAAAFVLCCALYARLVRQSWRTRDAQLQRSADDLAWVVARKARFSPPREGRGVPAVEPMSMGVGASGHGEETPRGVRAGDAAPRQLDRRMR